MGESFKNFNILNVRSKTKDAIYDDMCAIHQEYENVCAKYVELEKSKEIKNNKNNGGTGMFNMKNLFGGFGKIENGSVALTFSGQIAVKRNDSEYVRYNKDTQTMENQMDMVLKEASDLIFILPVDKVEVDDIIKHKETYYQILEINDNGGLKSVNIKDGSKKTIIKETNIMGFNFYYKVVSLFSQGGVNNSTTNGIDPMMLMMIGSEKDTDSDLLPLMLMSNSNGKSDNANGINPMMMMMMMSKDKDNGKGSSMKDMMMMQMMTSQGQNNGQPFNPMMLMMMGDGEMDMKTLMLMNMLGNNNQTTNKK